MLIVDPTRLARRFALPVVVAAAASLSGPQPAHAGYLVSSDAFPTPTTIQARARNGATGFEAVLFTPANPSPTGVPLNPGGTPAWSYGDFHGFEFNYTAATGTAIWRIDFNRDGDFLDSQESATSVSPTLAGKGFTYVNLFLQGNDQPVVGVNVRDFTLNGTNFGSYSALTGTATNNLFKYDSGSFDIIATGQLSFSGGSGDESPRLWLQMSSPVSVDVSAPGTLALVLSALGVAAFGARRTRRSPTSA